MFIWALGFNDLDIAYLSGDDSSMVRYRTRVHARLVTSATCLSSDMEHQSLRNFVPLGSISRALGGNTSKSISMKQNGQEQYKGSLSKVPS